MWPSPPSAPIRRMASTAPLLALALAPWYAACAPSGAQPVQRMPRPAALATVIVDNGTADTLTIEFRAAAAPAAPVMIGRAPPGTRTELAPVLAAEPITLSAARPDGWLLRLPPRSLEIDAEWVWRIPSDARFERPRDE